MRKLSLGVALLFLLQLGASAPQSSVDPKRSSSTSQGPKTKRSLSAMATPQAVGDQIVKFFGRKTGKELMAEKAGKVVGAKAAAPQTFSGKPSVLPAKVTPVKPGYVPPSPTPRASVSQIRQEIQKIFELNKKIKNVQSGRSVQLQRVQEQARIHQKILENLEASQKQEDGQKASAKNVLLAQEKLRIIHEETQRNTQAIDDLKEVPAGTVSKTAEQVKTAAS
ncbi:MAG: hypothetical protein A2351_08025 [Omnitrophica bacterium RIFOXYB12_FULL_50_7]|nr:MAG: hypothetical protein A2351_08025 [Omnitrophica bacterium RIFOXYB12_FULL_50_7]